MPCNGAIYLSICLLGQYIRTKDRAPIFPVNFNETFVVEKVRMDVLSASNYFVLVMTEMITP